MTTVDANKHIKKFDNYTIDEIEEAAKSLEYPDWGETKAWMEEFLEYFEDRVVKEGENVD